MIGLFIVVSIGAAVERRSTVPRPVGTGGALCHPTTTAVISAANAPISRILVNTTPPDVATVPCRECTSRLSTVTGKREHVLIPQARAEPGPGRSAGSLGWLLVAWQESQQDSTNGAQPTLWAVSDLHTGHLGNKPVTESLHPTSPDDWL